jgi:hypothetical protein
VFWLLPGAGYAHDRLVSVHALARASERHRVSSAKSKKATERIDRWWLQPLLIVTVLTLFSVYALWAALQNANYYADPYLSPFYSPCLAQNCAHATLPILGSWWNLSPAFLVLGLPLGFRLTCYYYRRAYYRSFFWSPPACAVPDARPRTAVRRFPFILQNIHRYFFWLAVLVVVFPWWDALLAFKVSDRFRHRPGHAHPGRNVALLSLYTFSCHSCRYPCGGYLDSFAKAPIRYRLWRAANRLNERHGLLRLAQPVQRHHRRPVRATDRHGRDRRPEVRARVTEDPRSEKYETHEYDVLVVGAGGAGLRAAIEAHALGARTAIVCKSLLGKAHTVMAEGGIAAAMGNVARGQLAGPFPRHHARRQAAQQLAHGPDPTPRSRPTGARAGRVGRAVRSNQDGRILQRDFGGHRYARLAHVGDRTA